MAILVLTESDKNCKSTKVLLILDKSKKSEPKHNQICLKSDRKWNQTYQNYLPSLKLVTVQKLYQIWSQTGLKLDPNRTGPKPYSNWTQAGFKLGSNWTQSGSNWTQIRLKLDQKWTQMDKN